MKTLTSNWRDHERDRRTQTESRYFDWHGRLPQSKESKCLWTHDKDCVTREFTKGATRGLREGWMEGNYLRWFNVFKSYLKLQNISIRYMEHSILSFQNIKKRIFFLSGLILVQGSPSVMTGGYLFDWEETNLIKKVKINRLAECNAILVDWYGYRLSLSRNCLFLL